MEENEVKHIYIIGSKGIPAKYGGFETFVEKLTESNDTGDFKFHVACMLENSLKSDISEMIFEYNGAECVNFSVPNIGPARAIYYDLIALNYFIKEAERNRDVDPVFYILACRIGPFMSFFYKKIKKIGGKVLVNPDGHEWLRAKWNLPTKKYWKISERLMIKNADLIICDSRAIDKYIQEEYKIYSPESTYISYGTDIKLSTYKTEDKVVRDWFSEKNINEGEYYLIVGRFVPENNYEIMITEFINSDSSKNLVIITNFEKNKFYKELLAKTNFAKDERVKFVGTVYDQNLLKYIRENSFAYIHGHEVGGTNPSLLEALYSTKLNLLLDVNFNREVGEDDVLYWNKKSNDLKKIINDLEESDQVIKFNSRKNILKKFTWELVYEEYKDLFLRL